MLLLFVESFAHAQSSPDLTSISLEDLTHVKVYSASRHLEDSDDAPSAVTVITAEDIRRYGWRTLAEALSSVRGFYTSYDRDYVYLGVLGVLRPGDYNCRILLLINGNRINENVYGSAPVGAEFPLDMDLVERIEVVRGPASSLFGTNAFFGVINVITREPEGQNAIEVSGSASSWMGRSGRLTGTFKRGRLSGLLSGSLYRSDGHPALYFPEFDSPQSDYGYARNMDGESYSHGFADFQYGRFRLQGLYSERTKDVPTAPFGSVFNAPGTYSLDRASYLAISYHRSLSSVTDLDVRLYYNIYNYSSAALYPVSGEQNLRGYDTSSARWSGTEATLSRQIGRNRFTIGGQYEYSFQVKQVSNYEGQAPFVNVNDPQWLAAWYAQAELKLKSKLAVNAGVRLDWTNPYGAAVSPRVALVYSLNSRTSLKYIFGQAFRAPNAYENWYQDGSVIGPHPVPLHPENIRSQDVLLEHRFASWNELIGEFFYNNLTNIIELNSDAATGLLAFSNTGQYRSRGLGAEFDVHTSHGVSLRASYMFADAGDTHGHRLAADPVNMISNTYWSKGVRR